MAPGAFHLVVDRTPPPVRKLLQAACASRGVVFQEVLATALEPTTPPLVPGSMLYSPAGSLAADAAERQLFQPGVATLHGDALVGPYRVVVDGSGLFPRVGLPVPRAVRVASAELDAVARSVEHVGGLPVILKVEGGEGGVGVMRFVDLPTLHAVVQTLHARGIPQRLIAWVPDALHWRLLVVGDRVVSAYRNPVQEGDFRSAPSSDPADHGLDPPEELAAIALGAAEALRVELAGVDVLVHPSGRAYLLEANFPCYFPSAQVHPGTPDVAGAIVDWLVAKAVRLVAGA